MTTRDVRVALARLVSSAGFAVEAFAFGAAFLRSVEDPEPECVVLDLHMHGMSGFALVGQWLFGAELTGIAVIFARVAGIALLALAAACWPGTPLLAMLGYGAASALYLAYLGATGVASGVLLWPAVVLHLAMTALLARTARRGKT